MNSAHVQRACLVVWLAVGLVGCPAPESTPDAFTLMLDAPAESFADASRPDAFIARCVRDQECDDGTFCNGREECRPSDASADALGCVDDPDGAPCLASQTCDEDADACRTDCARTGDADGDGVTSIDCGTGTDCDDSNRRIYPGAPEVCDDIDQDCDPTTLGTRDIDGDGAISAACCNPDASGSVRCGADCADTNRAVGPAMTEACDAYDNDCDGMSDEGATIAGFLDADGDQHGDPRTMADGCPGFARFSLLSDDCDDANPARHGGQIEVCNMQDDDCDSAVDEQTASVAWYVDNDGDGFGAPAGSAMSCIPIAGRSLLSTDCDDTDAAIHPGLIEACNATDDNCDGRLDYRIARNDFEDDDADRTADAHCGMGAADCDDGDPAVFPDALEREEGADNDCDGDVDEGCSGAPYYIDADDDGYGVESGVMNACAPIAGRVTRAGDCNDANPLIHPRAREACDGIDDDCNGVVDDFATLVCADGSTLASCVSGGCAIEECEQNKGNCNALASDGCERDLTSDLANCGACGRSCTSTGAHRLALCDLGHCSSGCEAGFGDCNGVTTDGCEVDVRNDSANCGACGRSCVVRTGTSGRCEMGACAFTCLAGHADCDRNLANGCEVATDRDAMNCGACGNACGASEMCIGASCVSSPPTDLSVRSGALETLASFSRPGGIYVIPSGRHDFEDFMLPPGQTIYTSGSGVLDIRVRGELRIEGLIDLSGGAGGNCGPTLLPETWANGGATGGALVPPGVSTVCPLGGAGGVEGIGGSSPEPMCTNGGRYGGGSAGSLGGGGGGGCAGGGGGSLTISGGFGGACAGETAALPANGSPCQGGAESLGAPYAGTHTASYFSGCGGSIGVGAAGDLDVSETFRPGSGGGASGGSSTGAGAGGGAGGGGGGALRLVSLTRIVITPDARIRANGGTGGNATGIGADGGGGGGSGGLIVLAAPSVRVAGSLSAVGGLGGIGPTGNGGNGGLGRIRISTYLDQCELSSAIPSARCVASPPGGVPGTAYVASYPN